MADKAAPGRLSLFLRASVFDFALTLVVSVGLVYTVSFGFNSAPDLRTGIVLPAVACAVLLAALYVGGWSKRATVLSALAYAVLAVAVVAYISSLSPADVPLFADGAVNDVEDNFAVYGMVVAVVPLLVYLLSRRTWSMAVLFVASVLACGVIQFLYRDWIADIHASIAALVVYAAVGALFVLQGYRQGMVKSAHAHRTAFAGAFAFGAVASVLCVGVGIAAFFAVISHLGLSTIDVKPFEDYYARPVIEYDGQFQRQWVVDPNTGTSNVDEDEQDTIDDNRGYYKEDDGDDDTDGGFQLARTIMNVLNVDNWNQMFDALRFDIPPNVRIALVVVPLLALLAAVLARRRLRTWRLQKLAKVPTPQRMASLYEFFTKRFARLKLGKAASLTPLEYALATSGELAGFTRNASNTSFLDVTLLYQRAAFGAGNISEDEYGRVADYYESFFKNARSRMGALKWAFWGFWRI